MAACDTVAMLNANISLALLLFDKYHEQTDIT